MVNNMTNSIEILNIKLTELQETILHHLTISNDFQYLCETLKIKNITLSKILSSLKEKNLYINNEVTFEGKKMVNYIKFRNQTIYDFLNKYHLTNSKHLYNQLRNLDVKIIIALKNALT